MKRFFQLRLLTVILVTLAAGILVGLNTRGIHERRILKQSMLWHSTSYGMSAGGCVAHHKTLTQLSLCYVYYPHIGWPYEFNGGFDEETVFFDYDVPKEFHIPLEDWPFALEETLYSKAEWLSPEEHARVTPRVASRIYNPPQAVIFPATDAASTNTKCWNLALCAGLLILLAAAAEFLQRRRGSQRHPAPAALSPA